MTKSKKGSSAVGCRIKYACHKSQVVHYPHDQWHRESVKYDALSYIYEKHITTHLHVYAKWNSSTDGIAANSKYDIFFCIQGQFQLAENGHTEELENFALYDAIHDLYPLAYEKLAAIQDECGVGTDSEHLLLKKVLLKEELNFLVSRDEIRLLDRR